MTTTLYEHTYHHNRFRELLVSSAVLNPSRFSLERHGLAALGDRMAVVVTCKSGDDLEYVWINQPEGGGPELPFGGTKRSGVGRELGPLGIDEFVNKKLIHTAPGGE